MKYTPLIVILALGLLLVGCADGWTGKVIEPQAPDSPQISAEGEEPTTDIPPPTEPATNELPGDEPETEPEPEEEPKPTPDFDGIVLTFTEGELIELSPEAVDPDGDAVSYAFGEPFTREGKWQTKIGDEGQYLIEVVASDGKLDTEENILIILDRANRAPVVSCSERAVLKEGERFYIGDYCEIFDTDDEEVVVYYSGWPGVSRYVTTYDDAGDHVLLITANDKTHIVKHELPITVIDVNRNPSFSGDFPDKIVGVEGDVLSIDTSGVSDPDGDTVRFTFSDPFDDDGVWRTELGDAGTYNVDVLASDGTASIKETVAVEVKLANTKPTLKFIADIEVDEGETITLPISVTDREGDRVTVRITGWMNSETYTTTYDDAGIYSVKIIASDGVNEATQVVRITVNDVNRPPYFITPA